MKNVNTDFLLDIWADLKAKKLAPVAIALGVAIIAMPALLLKGEETPSAGPLPIVAAHASDEAEVQLAEELDDGGSKLDSYKAHDPFDGLVKPSQGDPAASGTAIAPGDAATGDGTGQDIASLLGGGGGPSPSGNPHSVPGFNQPGDSGGGLTTGGDTPPTIVKKPNQNYTYELDVKFGRPGREKRYRHLTRMSLLPSAKVPALMFMGVPVDAKSAVFFVHPAFSHAGEGTCMPSNAQCNLLELPIGRDHYLSVDDYEFRIHLIGIKRVKIDSTDTQARKTTGTRRSGRTLGGADDADGGKFQMPVLVDGIG